MTSKEKAKKLHEIADALEEWGKYSEKVTNVAEWDTPAAKQIIRKAMTLLVDNLFLLNECKNKYGCFSPLTQCFMAIEQAASWPKTKDLADCRAWTRDFTERHLWGGEKRSLADECVRYAEELTRELDREDKGSNEGRAYGEGKYGKGVYGGKNDVEAIIEEAARDGQTKLDLSNRGIKSLPPVIGKLTNLTELRLYVNQLTSLPPEIGKLTNLTELYLGGNQLTSLPSEIGKLTNLARLHLDGNQLTSLPSEIGKLTNLTRLELDRNQLTSLSPVIGKLTNLTELYLGGNQLTSLPLELGQLKKLTVLNLRDNPLQQPPPEIVEQGTKAVLAYLRGLKNILEQDEDNVEEHRRYLPSHHAETINLYSTLNTSQLTDYTQDRQIVIGGMITKIRYNIIKTGRTAGSKMAVFILEDLQGSVDVVMFPDVLNRYGNLLVKDTIVFAKGKLDFRREKPNILAEELISLDEATDKLEYADTKLTISDFEAMLDNQGSRICEKVIGLATSPDVGLEIEVTDASYINLRPASGGRPNVIMQIHRYGSKFRTRIALVVAGAKKGTAQKEFDLGYFITKGDITKLSGYTKGSPREKAWLNGNTPHEGDREKATVYVIKREIIADYGEATGKVKELLIWAKENALGKDTIIEAEEARTIGNVPTMADDKASVKDLLGRMGLVEALANMFVHSKEMEGFTVALFGNWGEGKSTIMKLLEKHLKKHHRKRFVFAKFNAWEYEKTDNIAAGLALEVVKGLKKSFNFLCRITLYICFIAREHWYRFIWWITKFGLAVLPFILLYFFRGQLGLTEQQDKIINDLLGISLAGAGSIVIGFYVLKNFKHIVEHPLVTNLETFLKLPNYGKHLGLVPVLKRHIKILCSLSLKAGVWKWRWGKDRKLIVFVDDLDRCQPKCIAETLDAIRLVMENQNVIVFIGIDHRIAFKAIGEHYHKVGNGNGGRRKGEIARDYLGKIIQLPIRLQEPAVQGLEGFINERLFPNVDIYEKTQETLKPSELLPSERTIDTEKTQEETVIEPEAPPDEESAIDTKEILSEEITEKEMQDTKDERDEFYDMAKKFGFGNPRQLLRLRNCYRLIKALELQKARKKNQEPGFGKLKSLMRMLFWQEFLHNRSKRLRKACVKVLYENFDAEKISDEQTKFIVKQVKGLIIESFADKKIYDETAEDVRIVVLPHSQED